jgi:hypothetical protein
MTALQNYAICLPKSVWCHIGSKKPARTLFFEVLAGMNVLSLI